MGPRESGTDRASSGTHDKHAVSDPLLTLSITPAQTTDRENHWEEWCWDQLQERYRQALALKCPFARRRAADLLDHVDFLLRHVVLNNPSVMGSPLAYRCESDTQRKRFGMTLPALADEIRSDWRTDTNKGYYITGKMSTDIYRDDCLFSGPDPDMPVRGLRKYLTAASSLFDPAKSTCELISLNIVGSHTVEAKWRMHGRLRLPWKPWIPEVTGTTKYHADKNGLVCFHEEEWDMSVFRAFLLTFCPDIGRMIYRDSAPIKEENRIQS